MVLNIVALRLIKASPLPPELLTVLVGRFLTVWVNFAIQKINLKKELIPEFSKAKLASYRRIQLHYDQGS